MGPSCRCQITFFSFIHFFKNKIQENLLELDGDVRAVSDEFEGLVTAQSRVQVSVDENADVVRIATTAAQPGE